MLVKQTVSTLLHSLLKNKAVPVFSGPLRGWKWLPRSGNHAYWLGKHEKEYVNAFAQSINPGDIVFDIGAQAGYFTLVAARMAGKQGHIVSFEPFPENIEFIKEHCHLNSCENITLLEVAVGGSKGERSFQAANVFMGHLLTVEADAVENIGKDALVVEVVTLDTLPVEEKISVPKVMKIDTEGMEYWVLQGGKKLIAQHRPVIFVATHGKKNQQRTLALLQEWNYEVEMIGNGSERNADYIAKPFPVS